MKFEQRKQVEKLAKEGYSVMQIAQKIGVTRQTVYNELSAANMTLRNYDSEEAEAAAGTRSNKRALAPEKVKMIRQLKSEGYTTFAISKITGISRKAIDQYNRD